MFRRKELQSGLHQRQRCPQLMGGVARKLPLCIERLRQPVQHAVHRLAQLPELGSRILRQTGVRQAFFVDLFGLLCKILQRLQSLSAEEIRDNGTQQCHQRGDVPAYALKTHLFFIDLLRKVTEKCLHILFGYLNGHFLLVFRLVFHHKAVQRIHAARAGVKQQQIQAHTRRRDQKRGQYRNAPLDRNSFAHSPTPIS